MFLYLVQHGEALTKEADPDRPLSEAGRANVEHLAGFLAGRSLRVARVLHSGKTRARQTAEILAAALAPDAPVEAGDGLIRLHGLIESRLRRLGLAPEGRKFAAHVTLARLKGTPVNQLGDYLIAHGDFISETIPVSHFYLYSSVLRPKGALHRIEARYPLDG